jgi:transcriptional regulator with GAF, ATPase, and Fis domain
VLYLVEEDQENQFWSAKATAGEVHLDAAVIPLESGTLGVLAEHRETILFAGNELAREDYAHFHTRRTPVSLAYIPFFMDEVLLGCLEAASFAEPISEDDLTTLQELGQLAAPCLVSALAYEQERNAQLESISRLTQLYDLEKTFNSILEMDELLPIVASKFREILDAQAVNLWMVKDENELLLLNREGEDLSVQLGSSQKTGEGIAAEVSDSGEPLLVDDAGAFRHDSSFRHSVAARNTKCKPVEIIQTHYRMEGVVAGHFTNLCNRVGEGKILHSALAWLKKTNGLREDA